MLSLVTMQERPDIEQEWNALIVSIAEMKHDLADIEDRILHKLTASEELTIDDMNLILTIKAESEEIKVK